MRVALLNRIKYFNAEKICFATLSAERICYGYELAEITLHVLRAYTYIHNHACPASSDAIPSPSLVSMRCIPYILASSPTRSLSLSLPPLSLARSLDRGRIAEI